MERLFKNLKTDSVVEYRQKLHKAGSRHEKSTIKVEHLTRLMHSKDLNKRSQYLSYLAADRKRSRLLSSLPYLEAFESKSKNDRDWLIINTFRSARRKSFGRIGLRSGMYLLLVFYALLTLYPFIWAIFGSFRTDTDFTTASLNPFPSEFSVGAYQYLFTNPNSLFGNWVGNSFLVCVVGVAINLFLNNFAGYALARIKFRGSNQILWIFLAMIMVPAQVLLIPNYLLIKEFNLVDNVFALVLPAAVNIGYIFMSRQFFVNFPKDVEEAAVVDGMSKVRMMFRVVFPLMRPLLITQSIFVFMGLWNNFLNAKVFLISSENFTLPVGIQSLIATDAYKISYSQLLAASTISVLPVLLLYLFSNNLILKGQTGDGDK